MKGAHPTKSAHNAAIRLNRTNVFICPAVSSLVLNSSYASIAWRGECIGRAGRKYHPIRDLLGRSTSYAPKASEPDQRTGAQRWPYLVADIKQA